MVVRSIITDHGPFTFYRLDVDDPGDSLSQPCSTGNYAELRAHIAGKIGALVKISGMGLRVRVMDVRVCPLGKMIRLVRPQALQVGADIQAKRICQTVVRLAGTELPRADDQNV